MNSQNPNFKIIPIESLEDFNLLIDSLDKNKDNPNDLIVDIKSESWQIIDLKKIHHYNIIWKKENKSFILVSSNMKMKKKDAQEIVLIRSLEEAIDYLHMEELIRKT
jgi:hypothetical protein